MRVLLIVVFFSFQKPNRWELLSIINLLLFGIFGSLTSTLPCGRALSYCRVKPEGYPRVTSLLGTDHLLFCQENPVAPALCYWVGIEPTIWYPRRDSNSQAAELKSAASTSCATGTCICVSPKRSRTRWLDIIPASSFSTSAIVNSCIPFFIIFWANVFLALIDRRTLDFYQAPLYNPRSRFNRRGKWQKVSNQHSSRLF